jgi:hypothetical protein
MKRILVIATTVLLAVLLFTVPVFAWTGVYGQCIDSSTLLGWTGGGTVTVYDNLGGTAGSGALDASGNFNVTPLSVTGGATTLYIVIVYTAPPGGTAPGTYVETVPYIPTGISYNMGYVYTGTGPNAVTLAGANTKSPNVWLPVALTVVALIGTGGIVLSLRRRRLA